MNSNDKYENEILEIMEEICPDFAPYNYLKKYDLYKGSLFGGTNMYYKVGKDGVKGMVTTKKNTEKYGLDRFPYNFQTDRDRNGTPEYGWSGDVLLEIMRHLRTYGDKN